MVSVRKKRINGKEYLYAEHSFRLPNGNVKKTSKLVKSAEEAKGPETKKYFLRKEEEEYAKYASSKYIPDYVLTKQKIEKLELFKAEYRQIIRSLTKAQFKDILDRFTANFTYESNAIEGNSLTLKDVTLFFSHNILPKGKDLREVYDTKNTRDANELLFAGKIKITIADIIKLHSVLVKDTGIQVGFKKIPNFLLMRNVKTTPPEDVEKEMNALVLWYEKNKGKEHPLKMASEFHGRFEKIHPFEDGNGRVGRILINAILLENGYSPLIIRKTVRGPYFNALDAFDNGHKPKLLRFLLEKMEDTFRKFFFIYMKYI